MDFFYRYDFKVTDAEITRLLENFGGDLTLPENFQFTAQPYDGTSDIRNGRQPMCRVIHYKFRSHKINVTLL